MEAKSTTDKKGYYLYVHVIPKEISNYDHDKHYIGITRRVPSVRWGTNGRNYSNITFYMAIKKYGWDNIKHIVLFENLSEETANEYEKLLIKRFRTTEREFGYNISEGGTGGNKKPLVPVCCYNSKGKLLNIYKSGADAARNMNMSRSAITHCCQNRGIHKNYMFRYENDVPDGPYIKSRSTRIIQTDLKNNIIKKYDSYNQASKCTKINVCSLCAAVCHRQITAGGYKWYKEQEYYELLFGGKIYVG